MLANYYTILIFIATAALAIMAILVSENDRLSDAFKRSLYLTYVVIFISGVSEWLAVILNGADPSTITLHAAAKGLDYIMTPLSSYFFVRQLNRNAKLDKFMIPVLIGNTVLQILSAFTGWIYYIDESNYYQHGSLNWIYTVVSFVAMGFVIAGFVDYGRLFKNKNWGSLVGIVCLMTTSVVIQKALDIRVIYLTLSVCSIFLYVHYNEFNQLQQDNTLEEAENLLQKDSLTGLLNRYAYGNALNTMLEAGSIPESMAIVEIDINGLKTVNDSIGHEAGDELIKLAAGCISYIYENYGSCYRTGGDEFVVLIEKADRQMLEKLSADFKKLCANTSGKHCGVVKAAVGFALAGEHRDLTDVENLFTLADRDMYKDKDRYYAENGIDRRATAPIV